MKRKFLITLVLFMLLLPLITSCSRNRLEGINLVVIIGNRANSYTLSSADIVRVEEKVRQSFTSTGTNFNVVANIWIIVNDGSPWLLDIGRIEVSANNARFQQERAIPNSVETLMDYILNTRATNEESDLLEALILATRALSNIQNDRDNHVLIIDTGITTYGNLDMTVVNIQAVPHDEIIHIFYDAEALPEMEGITVTFLNIANAAYPQEVPRPAENSIMGFWASFFEATGAALNPMSLPMPGLSPRTIEDGYPYVTVVDFDDLPPIAFPTPTPTPTPTPEPTQEPTPTPTPVPLALLEMETLGFVAESAELLWGRNHAISVIWDYVYGVDGIWAYLESNPESMLFIIGSEARIHPTSSNPTEPALSTARARVVRNILVYDFGIPQNMIAYLGAGTTVFPWRNAIEFPDGFNRDESQAMLNRVVAIIPVSSNYFEYLALTVNTG